MAAFFSSINAKIKECGSVHFLYLPFAGLVCYKFIFHMTMASPLLPASFMERLVTLLTALFFAFLIAAFLTVLFSLVLFWQNATVHKIVKKASLFVFAVFMTLLALVVIENFTYTMFGIGIKNTDAIIAKLAYLLSTATLLYFFTHIGEKVRAKTRETRYVFANALTALAAVAAVINLSDTTTARASLDAAYPKRYNVVIVSSDGIAADHMSAYGYDRKTTPFIDSIAHEFLIAHNAFTNNAHTTGSITSLLTGMLPTRTKVVLPPDSLHGENAYRSLPRLLRKQGYYANNIAVPHYADAVEQNILEAFDVNNNRSAATSSLPITFGYNTTNWFFSRLIGEAVDLTQDILWIREVPNPYAQVDGRTPGNKNGYNGLSRLLSLVGDIASAPKPFFINSHFLGTHGPYFDPQIKNFSVNSEDKNKPWARDRYDDAILTFDLYVKRIYSTLKDKGLLEQTIFVVMSDHSYTYDPRHSIPLMIRFPHRQHAGTAIHQNVQTVGIAPTIIDALGGSKPAWMEGASLVSGEIAPDRNIFSTKVDKAGFIPGLGIVREQLDGRGKMDSFYMIRCNRKYMLNVATRQFEVSADADRTDLCSDAQRLTDAAAAAVMRKHLEARY